MTSRSDTSLGTRESQSLWNVLQCYQLQKWKANLLATLTISLSIPSGVLLSLGGLQEGGLLTPSMETASAVGLHLKWLGEPIDSTKTALFIQYWNRIMLGANGKTINLHDYLQVTWEKLFQRIRGCVWLLFLFVFALQWADFHKMNCLTVPFPLNYFLSIQAAILIWDFFSSLTFSFQLLPSLIRTIREPSHVLCGTPRT